MGRSLVCQWFVITSIGALGYWNSIGFSDDSPAESLTHAADAVLDDRLKKIVDEYKLPGIVAGIVQGDSLVAIGAAGVRKIGSPELMTVDDQMHLGSCTKAMTATAIATVVQAGKLRWDSTIAEAFPDQLEHIHQDFHDVTLTQLLTHRASFPSNPSPVWLIGSRITESLQGLSFLGRQVQTDVGPSGMELRKGLLQTELKQAPKHKPGTNFGYSNLGYIIAGAMAERVTGQSWESLMREALFKPLHMDSAGFGPPGHNQGVKQPWGHIKQFGIVNPVQADNPAALGPAGTVHASLPDWAKFASLHLHAARGYGKLLAEDLFKHLQTPPADADYACGWCVYDPDAARNLVSNIFVHQLGFKADGLLKWTGGKALIHNGSNTMWLSFVVILPERDVVLLVATNQFGDAPFQACGAALKTLMRHYEKDVEDP